MIAAERSLPVRVVVRQSRRNLMRTALLTAIAAVALGVAALPTTDAYAQRGRGGPGIHGGPGVGGHIGSGPRIGGHSARVPEWADMPWRVESRLAGSAPLLWPRHRARLRRTVRRLCLRRRLLPGAPGADPMGPAVSPRVGLLTSHFALDLGKREPAGLCRRALVVRTPTGAGRTRCKMTRGHTCPASGSPGATGGGTLRPDSARSAANRSPRDGA